MSVVANQALLGAQDPAPVALVNPDGASRVLLTGDHAGDAVPRLLGDMGVGAADWRRHIAIDIGIRALGQALATRIDAAFVHQVYSRLVIDCNRDPARADAIPEVSDGTTIPANRAVSPADRAARVAAIHVPYQQAIADALDMRRSHDHAPVLVALHSFTPVMAGIARPWQIGFLHNGHSDGLTRRMMAWFRDRPGLVVGDNEPYRMDMIDYSVPRHAFAAGLDYVEIEVRQDLIADLSGVAEWTELIGQALDDCLDA